MRRLSALLMVVLIAAMSVLVPASPTAAASFRNHVAQDPSTPTSQQSVRVWMQSDTAFGEMAGLEYNVGSTYVKLLGTFDTSGPAPANWRADIPAQPNGTVVHYQLFTRNQSGQDYGFSGFNWDYTVNDGDIQWNGLRHDTFEDYYRSPFGAVTAGSSVTLRFRTERFDVDGVSVVVYQYNPATNSTGGPVNYAMTYLEDRVEGATTYAIWTLTLATPASPAILYYKFKVTDRLDVDWYSDSYIDDHDNLSQGGEGATSDNEPFASFQITVYDPAFQTPDWLQNANVYQIFPDRFRNGDPSNDYCVAGSTAGCPAFYGNPDIVAHTTWNEPIDDPRQPGDHFNDYGNQFYGGDLAGITEKLDYLQELGIDTLYLTPIFKGSSNHRYDTDDYLEIDPALGTQADFDQLIRELERRGMYLILDGVFNHTSSDSVYFDRYQRYASDGACESLGSTYRSWFEFRNSNVPCSTGDYEGWFGYDSLAVLHDASATVRDFIYRSNAENVIQHWYLRGTGGWRFDVADEISHDWWRDFRPYAKGDRADGPLVGEVWYDASRFLLGDQLDSVMNYRFRKNILGFARGVGWRDNDNNGSNEIIGLTPSQFDRALRSVREDYPAEATRAILNLVDSHDTNRALFVLTLLGDNGLAEARQRLKLTALFQFTYVGAPMVYYGDEAALDSPSIANGSNGPEDDPYNRAPYPWADEAGDTDAYGPADGAMIDFYSTLAHLRKEHIALRTGSVETLLTGDTTAATTDNTTYAFARVAAGDQAVVVLNNGAAGNTASIPVAAYFADGTQLSDALSGATVTVSGGQVTVTLAARSGAILLADSAGADTTPPTASAVAQGANANGYNNSSPVQVTLSATDGGSGVKELRYWINAGAVTLVAGNTTTIPVSANGAVVAVRAVDNAGNISPIALVTVRIDTAAPQTSVDNGPDALTRQTSAELTFSSSETGSTFACSLDDAPFTPCVSPMSYTGLDDGSHTFNVQATDVASNTDPTPASHSWTVDSTVPQTSIDSEPATLSTSSDAEFTFSSSEAGSSFACSLDSAAFTSCISPVAYSGLDDGSHTFAVQAADAAGNIDPTAATFSWTIDTSAPDTTIDSHPDAVSNESSAAFAFSAEAGSSFQCKLDGEDYASCSSPVTYSGLGDGSHTFAVRATDVAGNTAATPADYSWIVDTIAPDTIIEDKPAVLSTSNSASFTFGSDDESISSFACSLDGAAYAACTSPASINGLSEGAHTFAVRATDVAGNSDASPASHAWTVDTIAPQTSIGSKPVALSTSSDAEFTFSSEAGSSFTCSLDDAPFTPCTSPTNYTGLSDGVHTFAVRATDAAGNTDPTPATFSWRVDTIAPQTSIDGKPATLSTSSDAEFTFSSSEAGSSFACSLDGAPFTTCTSPQTYTGLALGNHSFAVKATDAAGNAEPSAATWSWTIVVAYHFSGFYQPVDNLPTLNVVKAGSAVPLKFSLGGDYGLNIFTAGSPGSGRIVCSSSASDLIEETVVATANALSYDPSSGRYTFVWKTDKSWGGTCRQLVIKFRDGTIAAANFRFK